MCEYKAEIITNGPLTDREAEVLRLICEARSDKDIARLMQISLNTVLHHITHIYGKLAIDQSALNRRMVALRRSVSSGMVRLLCVSMMLSVVFPRDDQFARVGRVHPRPLSSRIKREV